MSIVSLGRAADWLVPAREDQYGRMAAERASENFGAFNTHSDRDLFRSRTAWL